MLYWLTRFLADAHKVLLTTIKCEPDPSLFRPVDITLQVPDTRKFENISGWKPIYSLEESVEFLLQEVREIMSHS